MPCLCFTAVPGTNRLLYSPCFFSEENLVAKASRWVLTISEDHFIEDVAKELTELGLSKAHILADIGCITGMADAKAVARMRKVGGVLEIEQEPKIQLPPEGDKNW